MSPGTFMPLWPCMGWEASRRPSDFCFASRARQGRVPSMGLIIARLLFLGFTAAGGILLGRALGLSFAWPFLAGAGLVVGLVILVVEEALKRFSLQRVFLAALGTALGLIAAQILGWAFLATLPEPATTVGTGFLSVLLGYLGFALAF